MNIRLLYVLYLAFACAGNAAPPWLRIGNSSLEVYTDTGEARGRDLLRRFDQLRQIFPAVTGRPSNPRTPIRVLCFRSAEEYAPFQPNSQTPGFYQGSPERDIVAMTVTQDEASRVALHEFTHALLNHSLSRLPLWLDEGLAELFSTASEGKRTIQAGAPVLSHLRTLRHEKWIPADELLNVDKSSVFYNRWRQSTLFYAESWALTHMLFLSPAYRKSTPAFVDKLSQGMPSEMAFSEAYGKSFASVLEEVSAYLAQPFLPRAEVPVNTAGTSAQVAAISEEEHLAAEIDLLLRLEKTAAARKLLSVAEKRSPSDPIWIEWQARLALHGDLPSEAEKLFNKAIDSRHATAEAYFESAVLHRDRRAAPGEVEHLLHQAVETNPEYAEANFLLGKVLLDRGQLAEALPYLRHAVQVLPRQPSFWQVLASAEWDAGNQEAASEAAGQCLNAAITEPDYAMAKALIAELGRKPERQQQTSKPAEASLQQVELNGILERVDCLGAQARIQIRAGGQKTVLLITSRSEVLQDLRCGDGQNAPATILYDPVPDRELGTSGIVQRLELVQRRLEQ